VTWLIRTAERMEDRAFRYLRLANRMRDLPPAQREAANADPEFVAIWARFQKLDNLPTLSDNGGVGEMLRGLWWLARNNRAIERFVDESEAIVAKYERLAREVKERS
jgi:hypothetical protein